MIYKLKSYIEIFCLSVPYGMHCEHYIEYAVMLGCQELNK